MTRRWRLWIAAICLIVGWAVVSVQAESKPGRVEIRPEQIRKTLAASGIRLTPEQLELLCTVSATQPSPRLKVVAIDPLDAGAARARLQCESTSVCLPFYVVLHWPTTNDAHAALKAWGDSARTKPQSVELLVHNGKLATMIFEGRNVRITQPVLCLQNGSRGQQIRVASEDRQRVWLARVTGKGIVTAGSSN